MSYPSKNAEGLGFLGDKPFTVRDKSKLIHGGQATTERRF